MDNQVASMLADALKSAHETLEGTMQGVTDEVAHKQPGGKAVPIGAVYVHAIVSEDIMMVGWAMKEKPLLEGEWAQKLGISHPHPAMDQDWEKNFIEWIRVLKMDLPKFQEYAKAVYKKTEAYLASLTDADLYEKKVDLSIWELGEWTLGRFVLRMVIGHLDNLTGEISAVKGVQGLKGYPF